MGQRIKLQRKQLKYTQEYMAERLDISVKHFSEVERGIAGLSLETLIKCCDILCINLDYIVHGEQKISQCANLLQKLERLPNDAKEKIMNIIELAMDLSET